MTIRTQENSHAPTGLMSVVGRPFLFACLVAATCGMSAACVAADVQQNPLTFREYLAMLDREIADDDGDNIDEEQVPDLEDTESLTDRDDDDFDVADEKADENTDEGLLGDDNDVRIAEMVEGRFVMPSLAAISTATDEVGNGEVPESFRDASNAPVVSMPESAMDRAAIVGGPAWGWSTRTWAAPNTFSNPRYFEDRMLERHGHERWGYAQPFFSGARFFTTVPMLPYLMAIEHPCHCESTLGYYRSGSCTPAYFQRPPWDRKALVAESLSMASGLWILP